MKEDLKKKLEELKAKKFQLEQDRDRFDTYQMAVKIFLNSNYGAQSMEATVFAGHAEYFSGAITSTSRIANILITQSQSKKIDELADKKAIEEAYGYKTYLDNCCQADTDSILGNSVIRVNNKNITIEDFFNNTKGKLEERGKDNLIKHLPNGYKTISLNKETEQLEYKKVKYIMAHKVKKRMFKIKHNNDEVIVTEDHSVIIKRNGKILDIKPNNIIKGDKIIKI